MNDTHGNRIPMNPHYETNESGKTQWHPGYELRKCVHCGRDFIVAIGTPIETFGRDSE